MPHATAVALCRVGGKERKRKLSLDIFHQMEKDALRHMQLLAFLGKVERHLAGIFRDLLFEYGKQLAILPLDPCFCDKLGAQHKRHGVEQNLNTFFTRRQFRVRTAQLQARNRGQFPAEPLRQLTQENARRIKAVGSLPKRQRIQCLIRRFFKLLRPALHLSLRADGIVNTKTFFCDNKPHLVHTILVALLSFMKILYWITPQNERGFKN